MKVNVNIIVGLAFGLVVFGFFGVFQPVLELREAWQPNDMYGVVGGSSYTTGGFSNGNSASGLSVPNVSVHGSRLSRRAVAPVFPYAPASAPAYSQSSIANRQSPIANRQGLYTTSSAEFRSFGGGASMDPAAVGGSAGTAVPKAAMASVNTGGTILSVPSLAYNGDPSASSAEDVDLSVSAPMGVMSSQVGSVGVWSAAESSYAGIGYTTGGVSTRGMSGRRNVPGVGSNYEGWLNDWWSGGKDDLAMQDLKALYVAMTGDTDFSNTQAWDAFLAWFNSMQNNENFGWYWAPVPDAVLFVLLLCLMYMLVVYVRTKKRKTAELEK